MFLKICSFDMEVLPFGEQMPTADKCPILLVSCHFNYDYLFNVKTRNIVYVLMKNFESIEVQKERIVVYTKDETKIIKGLFDIIKENDVITGYNTNGFDFPYVIDRARTLGIKDLNIGNGDSKLYYRKHLAKGFTVTKVDGVVGKILFDVLALVRREDESNVFKKNFNLKITKLEYVAKEILGIEKLEFPIEDMIKYWENTDDIILRNKFIDYCSRDSELALILLVKFRLLDKFFTLARASGRLPQEIIGSMGSGVMVENLLAKEFKKYDRLVPIRISEGYRTEEKELEGAEVAEPVLGVSENIGSGDYKSLYPSLMRKYNLCYSTLLSVNKNDKNYNIELEKLGLKEEDVEIQYDDFGNPYASFVRKEKFVGIVPRKLEELMNNRAIQKKEMRKYEKGTSMYMLWDATQNATKILLNSFYGYSGDSKAKIYSWFIATAVTTNGRRTIKNTWDMILNKIKTVKVGDREFTFRIIAGDSVTGDIPVMFYEKIDGKYEVNVLTLKDLYEYYYSFNIMSLEQKKEIYVQSRSGFVLLKNIIRHKSSKKCFEISTKEGYTKVTEDHSLFKRGQEVKPTEVNVGEWIDILEYGIDIDTLFESEYKNEYHIDVDLAWAFGLFAAEGSCGHYNCKSGNKTTWHIDNQDIQSLLRAKEILEKHFPRNKFKVIDIMESSNVRRLMPLGDIQNLVDEFNFLFYTKDEYGFKKVPKVVLNGNKESMLAFLDGYYLGDGEKSGNRNIKRFTTNSLTLFKGIEYIVKKIFRGRVDLDVDKRIESSDGKGGRYKFKNRKVAFRGTIRTQNNIVNTQNYKIINMKNSFKIEDEYVYDLETDDHTFVAGLGNIIHHNTDSSYIQVIPIDNGKDKSFVSRDEVIKAISNVLDKVNSTLEKPMQIDFENYIKRIIIVAKKRYAMLTVDDNGKETITSKGIETVRRDWCNYSTDTMSDIVDYVLKEKNIEDGIKKSVELVKERAKLLNDDKIDLRNLVLTKKLTKLITTYDNDAVHVKVAIKMKERGHASEVGDRIEYLITDNGKKLVGDRAEEANYVIKNLDKFKIDKSFYIEHQLIPPAMRILGLLGVKEEELSIKIYDSKQQSLDKWF